MLRYLSLFFICIVITSACSSNDPGDDLDQMAPQVTGTQPEDGTTDVSIESEVFVNYSEKILLDDTYDIKVNGQPINASVANKKLTIDLNLNAQNTYTINISGSSIKDEAGNYADAFEFSFTTKGSDTGKHEAENALLKGDLSIGNSMAGFSGTGYVTQFTTTNDTVIFQLSNIITGNYDLFVGYAAPSGSKICKVIVNNTVGKLELIQSANFSKVKYGKVRLIEGDNIIKITPDWTHFSIDYIEIIPNNVPDMPFNIDASLTTPNASAEAINVYNFLKDNFQKKIISGTMASHSTNIDEAEWVNNQTGKWPALTGFDFIDHTWPDQNWINYSGPLTLGSEWWDNNGLITLTWHWRDPLTKSGDFYTSNTSFDVSKITDTNSAEYKAMIADIDTIAGYLNEFKEANIPILWRPLHEAAGGWFWWGAKGAAPCKTLWQLMFDRLVNHHELNNLIWVWTTNTNSDALDWYPGHEYVDVIGMDIYPGENQHGSQYIEFNKVKEIFEGRKIITLSECGSVPDPELMMEYGDTWSWFMPWNGDYTRSDAHNGAGWWNTYFSNENVITRDQMPSLK